MKRRYRTPTPNLQKRIDELLASDVSKFTVARLVVLANRLCDAYDTNTKNERIWQPYLSNRRWNQADDLVIGRRLRQMTKQEDV